jgi:organic radical activating enzyme
MLLREVRALDIKQGPHHSVSLTGGEPLLHAAFLKKFLPLLKKDMFRVYLETNGTLPGELAQVIDLVDMVAMDLKLPSSTDCGDFWDKHERFLKAARAKKVFVKAVVTADTKKSDIARAIALVKKIDASTPFVIQPATPVNRSDEVVPQNRLHEFFDMTVKSGVADARIMPQVHKILGIK